MWSVRRYFYMYDRDLILPRFLIASLACLNAVFTSWYLSSFVWPIVNFTKILTAAFGLISFCQKITNEICKHKKVLKTLSYKKTVGEKWKKFNIMVVPRDPSYFSLTLPYLVQSNQVHPESCRLENHLPDALLKIHRISQKLWHRGYT